MSEEDFFYPEANESMFRKQKDIYHQYFHLDNMIRNLQINSFLNEEQTDRF